VIVHHSRRVPVLVGKLVGRSTPRAQSIVGLSEMQVAVGPRAAGRVFLACAKFLEMATDETASKSTRTERLRLRPPG